MVHTQSRTQDSEQEQGLLVDISTATHSAQALQLLNDMVSAVGFPGQGARIGLDCGELLLTKKILQKIGSMLRQYDATLETIYALLPQTQQAALDGGYFVRDAT